MSAEAPAQGPVNIYKEQTTTGVALNNNTDNHGAAIDARFYKTAILMVVEDAPATLYVFKLQESPDGLTWVDTAPSSTTAGTGAAVAAPVTLRFRYVRWTCVTAAPEAVTGTVFVQLRA